MTLNHFLDHLNSGKAIHSNTEIQDFLNQLSVEAIQITCKLNNQVNTQQEIRLLMSELTGSEIDESFMLFPPLYSDCGKNLRIGKNVFINSACHFQDQGGIRIGNNTFIGHNVKLATLNHGLAVSDRRTLYPSPIIIGDNVWIGAGVCIIPGITIGNNAVIGAGSVVTKNVAENTIVAGNPARVIKQVP